MSSIVGDRPSLVLLMTGLILAAIGLVVSLTGEAWGLGLLVIGAVVEVSGPYLHDRRHRLRGEVPHALWGENDRNRPRWLSGRR